MHLYTPVFVCAVPAVSSWYDQGIADAGAPQAAAQLMEQAVGQRLQRQHHQQSAEKETVGGLQGGKKKQKAKESESLSLTANSSYGSNQCQLIGGDTLQDSYTIRDLTECYYCRTKHDRT